MKNKFNTSAEKGQRLLAIVSKGKNQYVREGLALINTKKAMALIESGADVNARDNDGWTALMWVSLYGHAKLARALIKAGADVNIIAPKSKSTALHRAAWRSATKEIVDILLDAGADPRPRDSSGLTARQYVGDWDKDDYYVRLEKAEKKFDRRDKQKAAKNLKEQVKRDTPLQTGIRVLKPLSFKKKL